MSTLSLPTPPPAALSVAPDLSLTAPSAQAHYADWFALVFLCMLLLSLSLELWLKTRQLHHVRTHRAVLPAAFAEKIPLDDHQKAADYTMAQTRLARWHLLWQALILLGFTLGGGIAYLQRWAHELVAHYFSLDAVHGVFSLGTQLASGVLLVAALAVFTTLLDWPFVFAATFGVEARFGFNKMRWPTFLLDQLKTALLGALIGLPLLLLTLGLMERAGRLWWLWAWIVWVLFGLGLMLVYPRWIAPLFNRFTPLADEALKTRIEALLARCGFANQGVFVMDGSKRSSHGNAYFTGLGKNKRIVFFDTLLERLSPAQIQAVLAHELGHYAHRHILKRIGLSYAIGFVALALLGWLKQEDWFYRGLGVDETSTAAALILFFWVLPVFALPFGWISSWSSRRHEYEADAYAARMSSADDLCSGLVALYRDNAATLTPDPLHSLFYDSHPPAALRIAALQGRAGCV